jgi:hypothetical protein
VTTTCQFLNGSSFAVVFPENHVGGVCFTAKSAQLSNRKERVIDSVVGGSVTADRYVYDKGRSKKSSTNLNLRRIRHGNYPTTDLPLVELSQTLQFLKLA